MRINLLIKTRIKRLSEPSKFFIKCTKKKKVQKYSASTCKAYISTASALYHPIRDEGIRAVASHSIPSAACQK